MKIMSNNKLMEKLSSTELVKKNEQHMTKERNEQHRTNEIGKELHQTNGKKSSTEQMERMSGSELIKR